MVLRSAQFNSRMETEMELVKVLKILSAYIADWKYPISAEHDVIIFNVDYNSIPKDVLETLDGMGCFYSEEYDSLIMFV